jgi:hypothetical protein
MASVGASRRQRFDHQQRVRPDVAFGVVLRRLLDALHFGNLGQNLRQQSALVEQLEAAPRAPAGEDAQQFVAYPLRADRRNCAAQTANGGERQRLDFAVE